MVAPFFLLLLFIGGGAAAIQVPVLPLLRHLEIVVATLCGLAFWMLWARQRAARSGKAPVTAQLTPLTASFAAALLGALLVFLAAARWEERLLPPECERQKLSVDGDIDGLIHVTPGAMSSYRFEVQVRTIRPQRCEGPVRLRLYTNESVLSVGDVSSESLASQNISEATEAALQPGSRIVFEARLRRPWGMVNPAAKTGEKTYLIDGVHAVGSLTSLSKISNPESTSLAVDARLDRLREQISSSIRKTVLGDIGGLLAALAVGDRRSMTADTWERLRFFGLTHLMVISGMHVTMLALPGWYLGVVLARVLSLVTRSRRLSSALPAILALLVAGGYGLLSGFEIPAQRALLMLSLLMLPRIFSRTVHSAHVLPVAGIALFAINPLSILSASFWLTIGAVGLLLWSATWRPRAGWLRELWSAQGYMLVAMFPLGLYWFQEASSVGGVINLVAIPLTTLVVVPLLLSSLVLAPMLDGLSEILLQGAGHALGLLWSGMGYWESTVVEWSVVRGGSSALGLLLALAAVLLGALPAFPSKWLIICLLMSPLALGQRLATSRSVELVFFDVGQGTAVLLRNGEKFLLYDTGGGPPAGVPSAARAILPMFHTYGIRELDALVISHPDHDHDGGEAIVRERAPPNQIRRGVADGAATECRLGETRQFGPDVVLRYLSQRLPGDSDNNASCVLLISAFGRQILLPGDIDSRRERMLLSYWGKALKADVLLAGHHGSASSNSRLWLRSLAPGLVIATAGRANRFGHPAPRLAEDAKVLGTKVLSTAFLGAISLRIRPDGEIRCHAARNRRTPFWRHGDFQADCLSPREAIRRYNRSTT
ncbi:DNA internalization-related competence protein ComEC/Rec2 [Congregibacter sp.]|uniref:DNA internalization-related competence protein ComEC/Rec2 n=1 Tax=Congregibacter sp. TaxID=2744308 RepID=UPI003F6D071E